MSFEQLTLHQQAMLALRRADVERAKFLLGQAVVVNPDDAPSLALLAILYSKEGRHEQAVRALRQVIRLAPNEPNYHFNLAVALEKAGDRRGALVEYRHCLELDPDHARAEVALEFLRTGAVSASGGTEVVPPPEEFDPSVGPPQLTADEVERPTRRTHYFGEGEEPVAEIQWAGNIYDPGWDLDRYPGHTYGMDAATGRPNRILDAKGMKVADISPRSEVHKADLWFVE